MKTPLSLAGKIGLLQDDNGVDLPYDSWNAGRNIRFKDGYAQKHSGTLNINGTPSVAPYAIFNHISSAPYHVYAGLAKLYAVKDTTHSNITRAAGDYTGVAANKWTAVPFAGYLILTNGVDVVQAWAGAVASPAINMTNWPATTYCKVIRAVKNYLVALNITEGSTNYKSMVRWSHPADPGTLPSTWDYTDPTNESGRVEGALTQTDDAIVDGKLMGDALVIYKELSAYLMQWIGGSFIFSLTRLTDVPGALATNCVASTDIGHIILANGDVMLHANGAAESIIDRRNRKYLFQNIDGTNYANSFVVDNPWKSETWVCYPKTGSTYPDRALIWNKRENTWGVRDLPTVTHGSSGVLAYSLGDTWADDTEAWAEDDTSWDQLEFTKNTPRLVFASATNTKIVLVDHGKTDNGTAFQSYIERTGMDFGTDMRKLVTHIWPKIDGGFGDTVNVYVAGVDEVNAAYDWQGPYPFVIGADRKIDADVAGVFIGLRFETTATVSWRVKNYQVEYEPLGQY